jgi:hypothetical protein
MSMPSAYPSGPIAELGTDQYGDPAEAQLLASMAQQIQEQTNNPNVNAPRAVEVAVGDLSDPAALQQVADAVAKLVPPPPSPAPA